MDTSTWVVGIVVVLALCAVVVFAVARRGEASGEGTFGGLRLRVSGGRRPEALIEDATSRSGGATATSTGDAKVLRTEVEGDLRAEAGRDSADDPKD